MGVEQTWNRILDGIDRLQRRWSVSAFVVGVIKKYSEDRGGQLGALVAYYGLLSLFPLLVVLLTVLGFVLDDSPELRADIEDAALSQFPALGDTLRENIQAIQGEVTTLVLGLLGALWAGLAAVNATEIALNSIFEVPRFARPNQIERRARSLLMLLILGAGLLVSTFVANIGRILGDLGFSAAIWLALASIAVNVGVYALAFRTLVQADLSWSTVLPGAVLAGSAWWLFVTLGGWYVERRLANASATYGALASVIALLAWIYLQALLTILSAEVNVVLQQRMWPRSLTGRNLTETDLVALRTHLDTERLHDSMVVEVDFDLPTEEPVRTPTPTPTPTPTRSSRRW